jgi:hypothetical protein
VSRVGISIQERAYLLHSCSSLRTCGNSIPDLNGIQPVSWYDEMTVQPTGPGLTLLVVMSVCLVLTTAVVALRIWARLTIKAVGIDDCKFSLVVPRDSE